jgi:hypothetical protein
MNPISFRAINGLVVLPDPPVRTEKLFDWYFDRQRLVLQVTAAFLGAFLAAISVGALKGDFGGNWLIVGGVTFIAVAGAGSLIIRCYLMMQRMEEEFVQVMKLVS